MDSTGGEPQRNVSACMQGRAWHSGHPRARRAPTHLRASTPAVMALVDLNVPRLLGRRVQSIVTKQTVQWTPVRHASTASRRLRRPQHERCHGTLPELDSPGIRRPARHTQTLDASHPHAPPPPAYPPDSACLRAARLTNVGSGHLPLRYRRAPRSPDSLARGMSALRARAATAGLICISLSCALPLQAKETCAPMTLRADDLRKILGAALGPLASLTERYDVHVVPEEHACYLRMSIVTRPLLGSGCELRACSVPSLRGTRIGLRPFDVSGCSPMFEVLGARRRVPEALTNAEERIEAHCGAKGFEFLSATPAHEAGEAVVRVKFQKHVGSR